MIAKFPNFVKLDLSLKREIESLTNQFEPYSDFNFTSLFCWDTQNLTEVSELNDNLIIKMPDYSSGKLIYSLLGNKKINESLDALSTATTHLHLVPEIVIKNLNPGHDFDIKEDRDSFDYVYNLSELATLSGNRYKKKRYKANKVASDIGDFLKTRFIISPSSDINNDFKHLLTEWVRTNSQEQRSIQTELVAIDKMLSYINELSLIILEFRHAGKLVGFSINEKIGNEYAICHFEKAIDIHNDIYTFIIHQVAQELLSLRCKYVNWEQDLGIAGLRQSKSSFRPSKFLKKYTVDLRS